MENRDAEANSGRLAENLIIDRAASTPAHHQVRAYFQYMISTRAIPPGAALLSVRRLAQVLGLSRATVQRAYDELQRRGLVESRHGAGTFVVDFDIEAPHPVFPELTPYLDAAIEATIQRGVSLSDLEHMLASRIRHLNRHPSSRVSVAYIDEHAYLLRMADFLREGLADLNIDVLPVHLENFGPNGLTSLASVGTNADLIVCAPYVFGYVRRALTDRKEDVLGITITLHPETLEKLRSLHPTSKVGVVASRPEYLSFATAVVRAIVVADHEPRAASTDDIPAFERVIEGSDVIVFHAGSRSEVLSQAGPGKRTIELVHVPDPVSLERLRDRLKQEIAERGAVRATP